MSNHPLRNGPDDDLRREAERLSQSLGDDTASRLAEHAPLTEPDVVEAAPAPARKRRQLTTTELLAIFERDSLSLSSNKQGFVTAAQKQILLDELKEDRDAMWLFVTMMIGVMLVIAFIIQTSGVPMSALVIAGGLMLGPMLYLAYRRQTALTQDIESRRIRHADGVLELEAGGLTRAGMGQVRLGQQRFRIPFQTLRALAEFEPVPVRVYYAANSQMILSAEVIGDKLKNEDLIDEDDDAFADWSSSPSEQSQQRGSS